ncbi:AMP-binding protein [Kutzneria chonburiensis]|uniref:AMP-binding protein n=1 Tax=Kutzneria chonburiensis TaxID=1483604 RepID=A0ABV6N7D6_9PSEU|nr:AMP-binding protein [Kutzneria chonburiensis]
MSGVRDVRVLARAGMISPGHALRSRRALSDVRHWGAVVGAAKLAARRRPEVAGIVDDRGEVTFAELEQRSTALAKSLRAKEVGPDSVVAVLCRDHRGPIETLLACGKLGATTILLGTGLAAPQLAGLIRRERVNVLVHDQEFASVLTELDPSVQRFVAWRDEAGAGVPTLDELIADAPKGRLRRPPDVSRVVLLTSGTTGAPKAAPRKIRSGLAAADFLDRIPLHAGESTFIAAPIFHGIGFLHVVLALGLGSTMIVRRRFDARQTMAAVDRYGCSTLVVVPTMLQRIMELGERELSGYDLARLRVLFCSGSALSPSLARLAMERLGDVLYNFYGTTEVAVATVATPEDLRAAPGTVGFSPHNCTVRLYDVDNNEVTGSNRVGRIHVGGTLRAGGRAVRDGVDGLADTGDLGHFDEAGRLFIDGREDDMIISGGENVFPGEVENLLMTHYQVRDAAVIGVPDHEFGQRLRAFVVPTPGATLDPVELREFVRVSLARHKVPRDVVLVPRLPRTATGKVIRTQLESTP